MTMKNFHINLPSVPDMRKFMILANVIKEGIPVDEEN